MNYLIDTNVYSESAKPIPDPGVVAWLRQHEGNLYVSSITIGEIRRGIERLAEGRRKAHLQVWLQAVCDCMKGRVLGPPQAGSGALGAGAWGSPSASRWSISRMIFR